METESFKSEYDLVKAVERILKEQGSNQLLIILTSFTPQYLKKIF